MSCWAAQHAADGTAGAETQALIDKLEKATRCPIAELSRSAVGKLLKKAVTAKFWNKEWRAV